MASLNPQSPYYPQWEKQFSTTPIDPKTFTGNRPAMQPGVSRSTSQETGEGSQSTSSASGTNGLAVHQMIANTLAGSSGSSGVSTADSSGQPYPIEIFGGSAHYVTSNGYVPISTGTSSGTTNNQVTNQGVGTGSSSSTGSTGSVPWDPGAPHLISETIGDPSHSGLFQPGANGWAAVSSSSSGSGSSSDNSSGAAGNLGTANIDTSSSSSTNEVQVTVNVPESVVQNGGQVTLNFSPSGQSASASNSGSTTSNSSGSGSSTSSAPSPGVNVPGQVPEAQTLQSWDNGSLASNESYSINTEVQNYAQHGGSAVGLENISTGGTLTPAGNWVYGGNASGTGTFNYSGSTTPTEIVHNDVNYVIPAGATVKFTSTDPSNVPQVQLQNGQSASLMPLPPTFQVFDIGNGWHQVIAAGGGTEFVNSNGGFSSSAPAGTTPLSSAPNVPASNADGGSTMSYYQYPTNLNVGGGTYAVPAGTFALVSSSGVQISPDGATNWQTLNANA